jgi:hypothetical protein
MTPLERLLAEEIPTGLFGGPRPTPPPVPYEPRNPVTPEQAAAHYAALDAAVEGWHWNDNPRHHLRVVPDTKDAA